MKAVYKYIIKGNLWARSATARCWFGQHHPDASKLVMEGSGVLFKKFAGIDRFDIEIDATGPRDEFIRIVKSLEPTFMAST
jgi:malic enzyme